MPARRYAELVAKIERLPDQPFLFEREPNLEQLRAWVIARLKLRPHRWQELHDAVRPEWSLEKHGKTVAQVILRWLTQRNIIVIPKSVRRARMAENFDIFNFELAQEDMDAIRQLDSGTSLFFDHRDPAMVKLLSEAKRNT